MILVFDLLAIHFSMFFHRATLDLRDHPGPMARRAREDPPVSLAPPGPLVTVELE